MITPAEIETKEFSRAKKGYDEVEVDQFLDLIIIDMEKLIKENKELKEKLQESTYKEAKQASTETSVYETLEAAKSLMNDIAASAERRAEVLLKNAELEAGIITKEARENVSRYTDEGNRLLNRVDSLRSRYKEMLLMEIDRIDDAGDEILREFEKDFLPASLSDVTGETILGMPEPAPEKTGEIDLTKTMVIER